MQQPQGLTLLMAFLLIFSSRHHQAGKLPFYIFDVLHHLYSVFVHFVSWRGILLFPGFSMDGVGDTLFSIITLNFVCTVFAFFLFCDPPQIFLHFFFSYVYLHFLVPVFLLPDLIFFLLFFPQWNFSSSCTFFRYTQIHIISISVNVH